MNRFFLGAICGAVSVGLVLVVLILVTGLRITDQDVKVPSLLGDRPMVAKAKVEALGLKAQTIKRTSPIDPLGLFGPTRPFVARQVPDHGALIPSGGTVSLFIGYR